MEPDCTGFQKLNKLFMEFDDMSNKSLDFLLLFFIKKKK